jgi:serine phosphatase RsbU (regulator of sigma subunit)
LSEPQSLSLLGLLASHPTALGLGVMPLGRQMKRLAEQLEKLGQVLVEAGRDHPIGIDISSDGQPSVDLLNKEFAPDLRGTSRVWAFLHRLEIRRIELEPRLESNQIMTVLQVLFVLRGHLRRGHGRDTEGGLASALQGPGGLTFACTVTRLQNGILTVSYSYCRTRLSRLVTWFERRHPRLADHRALFWAAPRYGLLMGVMVVLPFVLYAFSGTKLALLVATTASAITVFGLSHLFFMTIGGLVYDNEEQGHQLRQAHAQLRLYADRIQRDLKRAGEVQQKLLPDLDHMPLSDRLEWAARFLPESEVGGDYFDAAALDSNRVAVVFADVSGHGMSAALVTAIIKMAFLDWIERQHELSSFLEGLNLRLRQSTPDESFAAVFACILDTRTGRLTYKNCGHNPQPSILRDVGADIERLEHAGDFLLGIQEHLGQPVATTSLAPGDTLLFASDGLIETFSDAGEEFGINRLERVSAEHWLSDLDSMVGSMIEAVDEFSGGHQADDDRTVLAVRIRDHRDDVSQRDLVSKETQQ